MFHYARIYKEDIILFFMAREERYSLDFIPDPAGEVILGGKPFRTVEAGDIEFARSFMLGGKPVKDILIDGIRDMAGRDVSDGLFEDRYAAGKRYHSFISQPIFLPDPR